MNAQYIKGPYHTKPGCGLEIFAGDDKLLMKMATDRPLSVLVPTMNLLLAAPELLEALSKYSIQIDTNNIALSCIEYGSEAVERELQRRAAIAKATGEQA